MAETKLLFVYIKIYIICLCPFSSNILCMSDYGKVYTTDKRVNIEAASTSCN